MIRPAIVLALLLSSAVMMRGVASDWRKGPPLPIETTAKKSIPAGEAAGTQPQSKPLQPPVPGVLPDLKDGYLFNPERMLAGAAPPPAAGEEKVDEASAENAPGIAAKIADVTYAGSIIADNFSRAIIVYTEAAKSKAKAPAQPASRSSKATRTPAAAPAAASGGEKHAQLEVGDMLDGYKVSEIQPDKIVFTKDGDTVEKLLYDPDKKRQAPPPRAAAGPPGGGPPRPAGVQATTLGGPASPVPPAPGTVNAPTPPTPPTQPSHAAANSPTPPAPVASPVVKSPPTPSAAAEASAPTTPVRRMVISRQPSTTGRPDTSRVIRQSQGGIEDSAPPMPPDAGGAAANDPTATPAPEGDVSQ